MLHSVKKKRVPVLEYNPIAGTTKLHAIPLEDIDDVLEDVFEDYELGFGGLDLNKLTSSLRKGVQTAFKLGGTYGPVPVSQVSLANKAMAKDLSAKIFGLSPNIQMFPSSVRAKLAEASKGAPHRTAAAKPVARKVIHFANRGQLQPMIVAKQKPHSLDSTKLTTAAKNAPAKKDGIPLKPGMFARIFKAAQAKNLLKKA